MLESEIMRVNCKCVAAEQNSLAYCTKNLIRGKPFEKRCKNVLIIRFDKLNKRMKYPKQTYQSKPVT